MGLGAIVLDVNQDQVYRAIAVGRSTASERERFHSRYVVPVDDATIEHVELLTPFRRVVAETERHLLLGDHMFGASQGAETIRPWRDKLTIIVRLRFHPQNVFVTVPSYEIRLTSPIGEAIAGADVRRVPVWARPDPNRRPGSGVPIVGATLETDFDLASVGQTTRFVAVMLEGKELMRAAVDFSRLD